MRDRMPPEMYARLKAQAAQVNAAGDLATTAAGFGASRAARDQARRTLVQAYGEKEANRLLEAAAVRHGAAPKKTLLQKLLG